jgi:hypothetical protein
MRTSYLVQLVHVLQWEDWRDVTLEREVQLVINMIGSIRRLKTNHNIRDKPEGESYSWHHGQSGVVGYFSYVPARVTWSKVYQRPNLGSSVWQLYEMRERLLGGNFTGNQFHIRD